MSEGSIDLDGELIDVSAFSLDDLDRIDRPVLAAALQRLIDGMGHSQCAYGGFQAVV